MAKIGAGFQVVPSGKPSGGPTRIGPGFQVSPAKPSPGGPTKIGPGFQIQPSSPAPGRAGPSHVTPVGGGKPATPGPSSMPRPGGAPASPATSAAQFSGTNAIANSPMNAHLGLPGTLGAGGGNPDVHRKPISHPGASAAPKPPAPPPALNPSQFPNTPGTMNSSQIEQAWMQNAPPNLKDPAVASNMANIAQAESSDTPSTIQQGQPPGTTGYGMFQITPTSAAAGGWNPKQPNNPSANNFGNLLNVGNNIRAAANVLQSQGYHAFTDPVGLNLPSGPVTK